MLVVCMLQQGWNLPKMFSACNGPDGISKCANYFFDRDLSNSSCLPPEPVAVFPGPSEPVRRYFCNALEPFSLSM